MTIDQTTAAELTQKFDVILKGDQRIETYREDTMFRGDPEAVIRARDEQDLRAAMRYCYAKRIPMTFCGSRTSMTGASIATEGVEISTERLEGIIGIDDYHGRPLLTTRGGTITAHVQQAAEAAGFSFPVAPTSRDDCRIAANVATNATGEDSFQYGPIRAYVRRLKVWLADGRELILERGPNETPSWERNRAGLFLGGGNPLDLFVGSEGTLGFISEVTLDLIPRIPDFFSALAPFPDDAKALSFIVDLARDPSFHPRALELIDSHALEIMKTHPSFPKLSEEARALVYFKQEFRNDTDRDEWLAKWYARVKACASSQLADEILIAMTEKERDDFRLWRHHIPSTINERARKYWDAGGGKVGSDWWVPVARLPEMMAYFYQLALASGLPTMAYAHAGSGHPHTNVIAKDKREMEIAQEMLVKCCRRAVALGGGVAGEHGIGKLHTNLLPIQHRPEAIAKMRRFKEEYDPDNLLGRGNIF